MAEARNCVPEERCRYKADASALDGLTASTIRDWASSHEVTQIVTPYAPVGPVRDRLDQLGRELNDDLPLTRVLRPWDARAWPHATRGFFPFRESIPALLREQQIGLERHCTAQTGDNELSHSCDSRTDNHDRHSEPVNRPRLSRS